MFQALTSILKTRPVAEDRQPAYKAEKELNFRWVSHLLANPAPKPLSLSDRVDLSLQNELSDIGQFAEVAHGSIDPSFVWKYMSQLHESSYPLYQYSALSNSKLFSVFHGTVGHLQCYIAYRPDKRQLVVAFSGTSSLSQGVKALSAWMTPYDLGEETRVHGGFWSMYNGIRKDALSQVGEALNKYRTVRELVLTGHSMGAVMSSLFCLDILRGQIPRPSTTGNSLALPPIKIVKFGAPRVGNLALAQLWNELTRSSRVKQYCIRNYNDGVSAVPPFNAGYRHLSLNPLYLAYGCLWNISSDQSEYSLFNFTPEAIEGTQNAYPLGGHNYYNGRDMELLQRRMKLFQPHVEGETWEVLERRFRDRLAQELGQEIATTEEEVVSPACGRENKEGSGPIISRWPGARAMNLGRKK